MDDLKSFRQLDSMTPGHPENFVTPGIEVNEKLSAPSWGCFNYFFDFVSRPSSQNSEFCSFSFSRKSAADLGQNTEEFERVIIFCPSSQSSEFFLFLPRKAASDAGLWR